MTTLRRHVQAVAVATLLAAGAILVYAAFIVSGSPDPLAPAGTAPSAGQ